MYLFQVRLGKGPPLEGPTSEKVHHRNPFFAGRDRRWRGADLGGGRRSQGQVSPYTPVQGISVRVRRLGIHERFEEAAPPFVRTLLVAACVIY